jgi:hypothetical protein
MRETFVNFVSACAVWGERGGAALSAAELASH